MTSPATASRVDAINPNIAALLKCGDLINARRLAEGDGLTWLVRNIDASRGHVESVVEYTREYSSDVLCGRLRTPGFGHSKQLSPRQSQMAQWIIMKPQERASHVLDVGCADGSFLLGIEKWVKRGTGVDLWTSGIRAAKVECLKRGLDHLRFVEGYFETLPFDGQFSAIVLGEILEHCVDPGVMLSKCHSLLAERGIVIVSVPLVPPESENPPFEWLVGPARKEHVRYVNSEALRVFAEGAGLEEILSLDVVDVGWVCRVAAFRRLVG